MALYKSKDLTNKTVKLINDFQQGKITPITTGIDHLDKACLGGLTPSFILGITEDNVEQSIRVLNGK